VAQYLRDARIAAIYEGTNGIQAMDLVNRKLIRDGGAAFRELLDEMRGLDGALATFAPLRRRLAEAVTAADAAARRIIEGSASDPRFAGAVAAPFLELVGITAGGWLTAVAALAARRRLAAGDEDCAFLQAKLITAGFYADAVLVRAPALLAQIEAGPTNVMGLAEDGF
jgi:alkylation response protein AidB-like acyl-CoA dehydrogenase